MTDAPRFNKFVSYDEQDEAAARLIGERLRTEHGIEPWLRAQSTVLGRLSQAEQVWELAKSVVAFIDLDTTFVPRTCPNDRVSSVFRYARQTAAGQPYIYLDVDPRYRYGMGVNATISIDYLDTSTDEIKL